MAYTLTGADGRPHQSAVPSELQTVLVAMVAREFVEEFMGNLETRGYLADQLEVPFLHELLATKVDADGASGLEAGGGIDDGGVFHPMDSTALDRSLPVILM